MPQQNNEESRGVSLHVHGDDEHMAELSSDQAQQGPQEGHEELKAMDIDENSSHG